MSKKVPAHRLDKDVPFAHLKPPEGLSRWTLDQINLDLNITSSLQSTRSQNSTLLGRPQLLQNAKRLPCSMKHSDSFDEEMLETAESLLSNDLDNIVALIDAALRLAITNLPAKALSGIKITERSSFKHLEDVCPAMWSANYLEVSTQKDCCSVSC